MGFEHREDVVSKVGVSKELRSFDRGGRGDSAAVPGYFTFNIENNLKSKFFGVFLLIVLSPPNLPSTTTPLIFVACSLVL
ncbi:hypothetical protein TorRG33x02_051080 [Trema orientale]|uniref:Uncharacterized protein n=1 Tax=Trema orientale TaxID=63057 RepID=A0A2P5FN75_TREOI|nr:hypothetical protein TorRG33x02_051080 [Trema orientale]